MILTLIFGWGYLWISKSNATENYALTINLSNTIEHYAQRLKLIYIEREHVKLN